MGAAVDQCSLPCGCGKLVASWASVSPAGQWEGQGSVASSCPLRVDSVS